MPGEEKRNLPLSDPLSEVTRKERRMLLGVSTIGIVIAETGLVPSKISALGIDFQTSDQQTFLYIVSLVVLYFLAAFSVYALSDFLAWRFAILGHIQDAILEDTEKRGISSYNKGMEIVKRELNHKYYILSFFTRPTSFIRALFEFLLPLLIGGYAAYVLWFAEIPSRT